MPIYFAKENELKDFLLTASGGPLFGAIEENQNFFLSLITDQTLEKLALAAPRCVNSARAILFPAIETVAVYPSKEEAWTPDEGSPSSMIITGLKECDLRSIALLDEVFLTGDYREPFYAMRRDAAVLVSSDCTSVLDTCFCNLVGESEFPSEVCDIHLSPLKEGFLVDCRSEKGEKLVCKREDIFNEATPEQLGERDANREEVAAKLEELNKDFKLGRTFKEIVSEKIETDEWEGLTAPCVECGACSHVCPTCHCFFLYDQPSDNPAGENERIRVWDSCVYADFSKMAGVGGAKPTPRPALRSRFKNRFLHKYVHFLETYGKIGCTGCGRCIEACLGGIDIRKTIKELAL